jgi:hypothetical protein
MRVSCTIVDFALADDLVGGMAGLENIESSTHVTLRKLEKCLLAVISQIYAAT